VREEGGEREVQMTHTSIAKVANIQAELKESISATIVDVSETTIVDISGASSKHHEAPDGVGGWGEAGDGQVDGDEGKRLTGVALTLMDGGTSIESLHETGAFSQRLPVPTGRQKISKVSSLLNVLRKITTEMTFENFVQKRRILPMECQRSSLSTRVLQPRDSTWRVCGSSRHSTIVLQPVQRGNKCKLRGAARRSHTHSLSHKHTHTHAHTHTHRPHTHTRTRTHGMNDKFRENGVKRVLLTMDREYTLLHLECRLISISDLNFLGLFSTERGKRDLEN